ncbi:MAG: leucyl aminopeptidase [Solirubrobacteraceae bacterium]
MDVRATTAAPEDSGADTVCVGLFAGEPAPEGGPVADLAAAGEARGRFRHLAVGHGGGLRWIAVGLGAREQFDAEQARIAAAVALGRAREVGARTLAWALPDGAGDGVAAGLVEGTVLAAYRFEAFKAAAEDDEPPAGPEALVVSAGRDLAAAAAEAAAVARAQNAARDLQNRPANDLTPTALGERAAALAAAHSGLEAEVEGREAIEARGMGAFAAVARGSDEEPALITLRYEGPGAAGPALGFVGKAVTFDSGGISIKPAGSMHEMKFDMSGGAAVLEAAGAIAALALPVRLVAVIGATENLPNGRAMKPGDIVRAMNGTTIEVNNTDAEGRLVLADCLAHAASLGAERLVDLATLTGAITVALGPVYAGLLGDDDAWCEAVTAAGLASGERVWRLPLDPLYADMIRGQYADIVNSPAKRVAGSITAAEFLKRFTGGIPWAHIDIAGTAWDGGRAYAPKGGTGIGVRLLVELARAHAAPAP